MAEFHAQMKIISENLHSFLIDKKSSVLVRGKFPGKASSLYDFNPVKLCKIITDLSHFDPNLRILRFSGPIDSG